MKPPAFQFYPAEFLSDENVVLMTNQEIGCYVKLLCYCWREGSIPIDLNRIAKLCGEDGSAMAQLWLAIQPCFSSAIGDPSRLVHPRLEMERKKQEEFRKERSNTGKNGANKRWRNNLGNNGSAMPEPMAEPMAKHGSSSSSSSSSSKSTGVFVKPSVEDVRKKCSEISLPETEAAGFIDYYESNGWRVGRNPMKSWEAALRNWKKNFIERGPNLFKPHEKYNPNSRPGADRNKGTFNEGKAAQYDAL